MPQEPVPIRTTSVAHPRARASVFGLALAMGVLVLGCKPGTTETANPTAPAANPVAAQIIAGLISPSFTNAPLTAEQADAIKSQLADLGRLGSNAVPAIGAFLQRNLDLAFDDPAIADRVGAPSLRVALISLLGQSPGPNALAILQQTLPSTADPLELGTLARLLDQAEPGKHRASLLTAARESLDLAASGNWDGRDVAPLFEIMVGCGASAPDVERHANTWFGYVPLALLALPDGSGVPALIKLAENAGGRLAAGLDISQRVLAEAALQHPAAATAFTNLARTGKIGDAAWPGVGAALAGHTLRPAQSSWRGPSAPPNIAGNRSFHLAAGNQNFQELPLPDDVSAAEIGARIRLIDLVLDGNSDPAALDALEGARIELSARLGRTK